MSTFWGKLKRLLDGDLESCVMHDFLIIEKTDIGYHIIKYNYILKCSVCGEKKEMLARDLNETVSANSPEFLNIETYSDCSTRKLRNKNY